MFRDRLPKFADRHFLFFFLILRKGQAIRGAEDDSFSVLDFSEMRCAIRLAVLKDPARGMVGFHISDCSWVMGQPNVQVRQPGSFDASSSKDSFLLV